MAPAWWNGAAGALWAASQASPLRRVDVDADLLLFQYERGYAAGYAAAAVADSVIQRGRPERVPAAVRRADLRLRAGLGRRRLVLVFAGATGAPADRCDEPSAGRTSPVAARRRRRRPPKPYVRWAADTAYELVVPARRSDAAGPSWVNGDDGAATVVGFDRVYVASAAGGKVDTMVAVDADGVLGDNVWLWRADHDAEGLVYDGANAVANGLRVAGDGAAFYGLAVEHQLEDLVVWEGDNGTIFFYQSELPYDVDSYDFAAYRVAPGVDGHVSTRCANFEFAHDTRSPGSSATRISSPPRPREGEAVSPDTAR
ncbi:hypothetical protein JL722_12788 [Aureococcus anophagefferens]|nr:hypothetical protein JL722_12788 [Aureococcus anophagefferens]